MEKEKMENQKIEEKDLEKTAGGYERERAPFIQITDKLLLNEDEESILSKAGYIEQEKDTGREYISRSKLKEATELLNKKGKIDAPQYNCPLRGIPVKDTVN